MVRSHILLCLSLAVFVAGCGGDKGTNPVPSSSLTLNLQGVEALAGGFHYEGWAILGGPVSTGKFNVGTGGQLMNLNGTAIPGNTFQTGQNLSAATAIVVTIEPNGDTNSQPAATHYLAGSLSNGSANLSVGHAAAIGNSFATASGKYILATPTNGSNNNENSGIWFLDLGSGSPAQGLQLPALPAGWQYEGWVVISGKPVTTGKFSNPGASDLAAPFSDVQSGPPFPGEDFLRNAPATLTFPTNLASDRAVVSVEPDPDSSSDPFTLKPLNEVIPAAAQDHITYNLTNVAAQFPYGTATIR